MAPTVVATLTLTVIPTAMISKDQKLIRLLQLVSPSLPTGSFSYSQGLEWAVEAGWVHDAESLKEWLSESMRLSLAEVDIPLLTFLCKACNKKDKTEVARVIALLLACRESHETQEEERTRGRAMATLMEGLSLLPDKEWKKILGESQLAGFAWCVNYWKIDLSQAAVGYLWSWLENQVIAGVKIVPLGQTAGQQLLLELGEEIGEIVSAGLGKEEQEIGASCTGLALSCCFHETQYTRLYRS